MEMQQARYFHALAKELNFTRAAARCGVAQPSLTRAIRLLEEEFGGRLFHRDPNQIRLTELGRMVLPHAEAIVEHARLAAADAEHVRQALKSGLRLGIMCTIAPVDLVDLLIGFRARHPDIAVEMFDADLADLETELKEGRAEVALLGGPPGHADPDLHYLPLYRERYMIVTDGRHPFATRQEVKVADLAGHAFVRRVKCELAGSLREAFGQHGIGVKLAYQSDRDDWVLAMTAAGLGFAFLPERTVAYPGVRSSPLTEPEFWREVSLATVRGRPHSPAVGALVQEVMRTAWSNARPLAVQRIAAENLSKDAAP